MSRVFVAICVVALLAITGVLGWVFLSFENSSLLDALVLVSSLLYQVGAIPREIYRNFKRRSVNKVSNAMAFFGAASYTTAVFRAAFQPDWVDVASRFLGMVGSLVLLAQLVRYRPHRAHVSGHSKWGSCSACEKQAGKYWPRPCFRKTCKGKSHVISTCIRGEVKHVRGRCNICVAEILTYAYLGKEGGTTRHYWLSFNAQDPYWIQVGHNEFMAIRDYIGADPKAPYFAYPRVGRAGAITTERVKRPTTKKLVRVLD